MSKKLRYVSSHSLVDLSCRCIQGRFLLRPSKLLNQLILGVLVLALRGTNIQVHSFSVLSNHWHLLVSIPSTLGMVLAMKFFQGNVSKEAGRLHRWRGTLWSSPYHDMKVDDDEASQVARLRYHLAQGVKEGLVWNPKDWPGIHSARALIEGRPLVGCWISRASQWAARRRKGADASDRAHSQELELHLAPIPCWAHLPEKVWRQRVAELVEDIEREARQKHAQEQTVPLGSRRVRKVHPHHAPEKVSWSPMPRVFAQSPRRRRELLASISEVVAAYRDAADRLRKGVLGVRFPEGTFPPGLPYVPTAADLIAGG
jgi:REP element-mobilizing transposase RayT